MIQNKAGISTFLSLEPDQRPDPLEQAGGLKSAYRTGKKVSLISMLVNALLAVAKCTAGYLAGSAALIADGVHTLSDIATSMFVYLGMRIAEREPDADHPYGHGKAESVAGKAVSVALVMVGIFMIGNAISVLMRGSLTIPSTLALWVAGASIVVKELLYQYTAWHGRRLESTSLMADAWHHRSDAISSLAAIVGIAIAIEGGAEYAWCDPAAAAVVAVFIIGTGVILFRQTANELMDVMVDSQTVQQLCDIALQVEEVKVVETIRARKSGLGMLADLHIEIHPLLTVEEGHRIAHLVKASIQKAMPAVTDVTVHIEPWYPEGPKFKRDQAPSDEITPTSV